MMYWYESFSVMK